MPEAARAYPSGGSLRNAQSSDEQLGSDDEETFAAVRALLMSEEQAGLTDLRSRVDTIERTTFDRDRKRDEVADVLADALAQATRKDGDRIDAVIAPAIGEGIRNQLKNERPAMVAALVPMVGTLVAGAVGEAIGKVSSRINQKFDRLLSAEGLRLAIRARMTGSSIHDVLLADLRKTEVERLYLFARRSEKLVFCWPAPDEGEGLSEEVADEILHAVFAFSSGMIEAGDHGVRSIVVRDRHLIVQGSDTHLVVIEVSGMLSDARRADLTDACFEVLTFVSDLTGDLDDVEVDGEAMGLFAARIIRSGGRSGDRAKAKRRRVSPAVCAVSILGLLVAGCIGWGAYRRHALDGRADAVKAFIASRFAAEALMLSVRANHDAGAVSVLGVAFADGDRPAIRARAAALAAPYALDFNLVNSDPGSAAPRLAAIETGLGTLRDRDSETRSALEAVDARAAQAQARADALWSAQRQLSEWIASHAIFFSVDTAYRDDPRAGADLDTLATLLANAPGRPLRITGYTDLVGPEGGNVAVARARSARIAADLAARGVSAERLIVLGRTGRETVISPRNGPRSPNRRVEFALGFVGEK